MPQVFGKLPTTRQPWISLGNVDHIEKHDRGVILTCGTAKLRLTILAANLVRVQLAPQGEFLPRRSWAVNRPDEEWEQVPFELEENEIRTSQIRVVIQRSPCRIQWFDQSGQPFAHDTDMGWRMGQIACWKRIETEEHFYGFGERAGLLDKRSEVKTNWTKDALDYDAIDDEMYQAIPFFIALRPQLTYGIFLNITHLSQFDLGASEPGIWRMQAQSQELDYYVIHGDAPAQILETYTALTGRMPLPPKWALGYHQCRWSYETAEVVQQIAHEFRSRKIPCDVIHFDIDYMNGYRVFTWSPKRFPDPAKLIQQLKQEGFKTVTIVDPGVKYEPDGDYLPYHEGLAKDCFVRNADGSLVYGYVWPDKAVFPDFLRAEVRQWWGEWQRTLTEVGVEGIWNDMNEPALTDRPFGDEGVHIPFPMDAPQGNPGEGGTHAETHNLYGYNMARASAEGLRQLRDQRSFVLTRSGFAGIQRWSAVWTGDNQSLWEHLEMSLPMLMNLGLSGVSFVGSDIGGFAGNATGELFARWMQIGMFYPLMRGHSSLTTAQHEPWVFGERVEAICREYIELRYQLLPYLYTLFWQSSQTGAPILRPLLYEYPNDSKTYHLHDQLLLGSHLMAAPVYRPGVEYRAVYLPEGTWFDWWTGEKYEGNQHILAHAPLERMPMYVKAGAIIPMQPVMQYVDEHPIAQLKVRIYPGVGEFTLYEDDGRSLNPDYRTTTFQVNDTIVKIQPSHAVRDRTMLVEMVGVGEQSISEDGSAKQLDFHSHT
ncbi:glycoside hydrolase family 31 protein [Leptolyngbya sp. GGD]|uniref:glycoside hydrolase family 31 protein n=1 Tax=Leptolyngbya sp. GGD TaxID=2997907 RepID=UPI00227D458B|nr:glycoside hydrolase family 31 protein [Leptolyngbya sp. GGD]MCY6490166.1 glycoside hydrolase family 31 protein [Leptolyngbya sp. GGD]